MALTCLFSHKWNGCKCSKCGKTRDEQHSWQNGKCSVCGKHWIPTNPQCASNMPFLNIQSSEHITNIVEAEGKTVNPIVNQNTLAETAKNDKDSDVRRAAIKKITDLNLLAEIAINASVENNNIGMDTIVAYKKVKAPDTLAEIAKNAKEWSIRAGCCKLLEDTKILDEIAKEDSSEFVREAAKSKSKIISERKPRDHEPSFESLFFQVSLFARGGVNNDMSMPFSYASMKICDDFVSYGNTSAQVMKSFLMACAAGKEQYGWWENARLIVECIPLAAGDSEVDRLMLNAWLTQLVNVSSNIFEYDENVRRYAQIELDVIS